MIHRALAPLALALLLVSALGAPARADDALLAQAAREYATRDYEAAIAKYEEAVARGVRHPDVSYNLGNAYFRSAQVGNEGRLGRAILAYERALVLDPGLEDARYNLEVARELVGARWGVDKVKDAAAEPRWVRAVTWLPLRTLAWTFLALDVVFFGILLVVRFLPTGLLRTGLVAGNVFLGVVAAVVGVLYVGHAHHAATARQAVVVGDEVVMRDGPDQTYHEGPKLHAGHRARVVRSGEPHGWVRIRLANGMEGWVPKGAVEEIRPSRAAGVK